MGALNDYVARTNGGDASAEVCFPYLAMACRAFLLYLVVLVM